MTWLSNRRRPRLDTQPVLRGRIDDTGLVVVVTPSGIELPLTDPTDWLLVEVANYIAFVDSLPGVTA